MPSRVHLIPFGRTFLNCPVVVKGVAGVLTNAGAGGRKRQDVLPANVATAVGAAAGPSDDTAVLLLDMAEWKMQVEGRPAPAPVIFDDFAAAVEVR